MKSWLRMTVVLTCLVSGSPLPAQTSLQVLEQDLQDAKQKHDDAQTQLVTTFLTTIAAASQSPSEALDLYKNAGGNLPDAAPVKTRYEHETPTEKEQREAQDNQVFSTAATVIQIQCGLMHNAALLTLTPDAPGVQAGWLDWLTKTAAIYPQIGGDRALKNVSMRDSVITNYLAFHQWGDKDPGKWAIRDLPDLYYHLVLEPTRNPPTAATLDLWDTYIAMRHADEPDHDKWTQEDEPAYAFDRGADDFAVQPSMEKLTLLDQIIKENPAHPKLDDWIARMKGMIRSYQGNAGTAPSTASQLPGATPGTPSSEAAGTLPAASATSPTDGTGQALPAATPGTPSSVALGPVQPDPPTATTSSSVSGATPIATPGTTSSATNGQLPGATPGGTSSSAGGVAPAATPGTTSPAVTGSLPAATPGTPSSEAGAPLPAATPGTPSSAATGPLPAATPATPNP